jgi:hypothetical protein
MLHALSGVNSGTYMEMEQFKVCRAVYAGYTVYYLVELDSDGYNIGEYPLHTESNNIRLNQNFR